MSGKGKYAWVSIVYDEKTCLEALVLSSSLTRVGTFADKVVLIPEDLSENISNILADSFDAVIYVPWKDFSAEDPSLMKMFAWTLTMYEKCVVLNPNFFVVKNSDELFKLDEVYSSMDNGNSERNNSKIAVIKPSYKIFSSIAKLKSKAIIDSFAKLIAQYFTPNGKPGVQPLSVDYCHTITNVGEYRLPATAKIICVDHFNHTKFYGSVSNGNFTDKEYLESWMKTFTENFLGSLNNMVTEPEMHSMNADTRHYKDSIAIVGQSCRFPQADNGEEFWNLLVNGGDGITQVPPERLFEFQMNDPEFMELRAGFLKCKISEFDAKFFEVSQREALIMDPQQRLMLEVAWEALENAAIDPESLKGSRTGVFSGLWRHDYEKLVEETTPGKYFHHVVMGNSFGATSSRTSYFLGLNGPNIATESGCSSSMVALHLACDSLRKGESNLGIVLGANVVLIKTPFTDVSLLAKDSHCKTFDEKADGFVRSDGFAAVVVKRLTDAIKDGDNILGIIRGSGISCEGTSTGFGTPSTHCQTMAIESALKVAGVSPTDVSYVEAHGTGTPVGDPIEFSALSRAYRGERDKPLVIGSVKTNIGHTESTSGLAGLIKVLYSLKNEIIPRHLHLENVNPDICLDDIPAVIPIENMEWPRKEGSRRIAGVSSFGMSGTNVHVIVEEPPGPASNYNPNNIPNDIDDLSHNILTLSAKTESALEKQLQNYLDFFNKNPNVDLGNAVYTTNIGRAHFKHRSAIVGKDIPDMVNKLGALINTKPEEPCFLKTKPRIAFLFTGQGSQYFGMAHQLYQSNKVFQSAFHECSRILENNLKVPLEKVLWDERCRMYLSRSIYSQTAIFSIGYCMTKMWKSLGVEPSFVLGHSAGEFGAAAAADMLTVEEALRLVITRSFLVEKLPIGGMLAIQSSKQSVSDLIAAFLVGKPKDWLDIAVINSEKEIVVAGERTTVENFTRYSKQKGFKCKMLASSHAFHSRMMDSILGDLGNLASSMVAKHGTCNFVSGSTGMVVDATNLNKEYWQNHARDPVNFPGAIKTLEDNGCNVFIEIGGNPILLSLGMSNCGIPFENSLWLPTIRQNEDNWSTVLDSLGKLYTSNMNIKWAALHVGHSKRKIDLPTYPFERQKYWLDTNALKSRSLHPLLGEKVLVAGSKDYVYENTIDLNNFEYLLDHQVGNIVILPGAGFLEIILAAGKDCISQYKRNESIQGINVEEFVVDTPLELCEGKSYRIQVVATPLENTGKIAVKFYVYQNLNGYNEDLGWKLYAHANITSQKPNNTDDILQLEKIEERCRENVVSCDDFYKYALAVGLGFGNTFKVINPIMVGVDEAVAEITIPTEAGNLKSYNYHPIILDSMFQTLWLSIGREYAHLYLPVGVGSFTVHQINQLNPGENLYAHAIWDDKSSKGTVKLYNKDKTLLCVMNDARVTKTGLNKFHNMIHAQKNELPGLFQEYWRRRDNPLEYRVDLDSIPNVDTFLLKLRNKMAGPIAAIKDSMALICHMDKIISNFLIDTFAKAGWAPNVGDSINVETLLSICMISPAYEDLCSRLLHILCEDGFLKLISEKDMHSEWAVIKLFPTKPQIETVTYDYTRKLALLHSNRGSSSLTLEQVSLCLKYLLPVLQGELQPNEVLFGKHDPKLEISKFFSEGEEAILANELLGNYFGMLFSQLGSEGVQTGKILRILEIGSGNGSLISEIAKVLRNAGIAYKYTLSNIFQTSVEAEAKKFNLNSDIEFKILNIENDPLRQGFVPHHYDVIIASNVVHATAHLHNSVQNIRKLLKTSGLFFLQEVLGPKRHVDIIRGLLDTYWKFRDYDIRPNHSCVDKLVWDQVLAESGFAKTVNLSQKEDTFSVLVSRAVTPSGNSVSTISKYNTESNTWIIFCDEGKEPGVYFNLAEKLVAIGRKVHLIKDTEEQKYTNSKGSEISVSYIDHMACDKVGNEIDSVFDSADNVEGIVYLRGINEQKQQAKSCVPLLNVAKSIISKTRTTSRFYVVTRGIYTNGDQKTICPESAPLAAIFKTLSNELPQLTGKFVDLDPDRVDESVDSSEIFNEMFTLDNEHVCFREGKKFVGRLGSLAKTVAPVALPNGRYTIVIPSSKKIDDVSFVRCGKAQLKPYDVEVDVKATALNFRDVFVILKPGGYKSLFDAIGTDFAGTVSHVGSEVTRFKIGDQVFGISRESSAASHVVVDEKLVLLKPKYLTANDACTLPSVFLTAYYCLTTVAQLQRGETVLIHVASGGVGLVAIQIAQRIGAKIIATAGSNRKREYIRSLGVEHVFHSRDLSYGENIKKVTSGKGVDVILNSLTGQGFKETSLDVCGKDGRFVEIGKVNIWEPEQVLELRKDVKYTVVDLEKVNGKTMDELMAALSESMVSAGPHSLKPLPYTRFSIAQTGEALNYFMKAQHIGKIVLSLPKIHEYGGQMFQKDVLFNTESTYLLTGGFGGIGLEVAKWMVDCGAKNLVLVGRSAPGPQIIETINKIKNSGCSVFCYQVDIGNWEQCKGLFETLKSPSLKLPPLRGIIHSAGVLSDGILSNQTWEKFQLTFNPKVNGGWNLHKLSLNLNLEHFIVFSSMAAVFGPMGQGNYSAANMYLDSLIHYRHSKGLPGQSINWGAWSEIGVATKLDVGKEGVGGIRPFNPSQGIATLQYLMNRQHLTQTSVAEINIKELMSFVGEKGTFFSELIEDANAVSLSSTSTNSNSFWVDILPLSENERAIYIKSSLEKVIRQISKLPANEKVDENQTFAEMGLDSLMTIEVRNKLQRVIGNHENLTLHATTLLDNPTVNTLSKFIAAKTMTVENHKDLPSKKSKIVKTDQVSELVQRDSILPKDIVPCECSVKPSEIKTVLLTGATGYLGAYLLVDLLKTKVKIYCLVRAPNVGKARERLRANIELCNLPISEEKLDNIGIVLGDVAHAQLGLSNKEYSKLSSEIECVIHLAAKLNHVEQYRETKDTDSMRAINIFGVVNILRFACNITTKFLLHASTLGCVNKLTNESFLAEEFPLQDNVGEGLNLQYALTKLVAEKLIRQAIERGMPCRVLRYSQFTGDSKTGHFPITSDSFFKLMKISIELGVTADTEKGGSYVLPIDLASSWTMSLLFNNDMESNLYNLVFPSQISAQDVVDAMAILGQDLKSVTPQTFLEKLKTLGENHPLSYLTSAHEGDILTIFKSFNTVLTKCLEINRDALYISPNSKVNIPNFEKCLNRKSEMLVAFAKFIHTSKPITSCINK